tara:strand:- start:46 stop:858 length:813 start_codon:yes stop_codon:yes gene_type:complete
MKNKKKFLCPLCNSKKIEYSYTFKKIKHYECKDCLLIFQEIFKNKASNIVKTLKKFYSKEYYEKNYKKENAVFKPRKKQYILDKKILLEYFKDHKSKSILDYGCGNGLFLKLFKSKKFGHDLNPNIEKKSKIIYLNSKEIIKKKFDLIIMRGSLEHMHNFKKILKLLFSSTKNGGLFFITATPNSSSLAFNLNRIRFNQNHEQHILHFNHINLSNYFLKNKFLNVGVHFQYFKTPYMNLKRDYKMLKNPKKGLMPPSPGNMMTLVFKKMI